MDGQAVEFDCPGGCGVTTAEVRALAAGHRRLPVDRSIGR